MAQPLRIVPLLTAEQRAAPPPAAAADVTYHGGPVLTAVEVVTIFWGAAWSQPTQATLAGDLNAFFDAILASSLMDLMAEYGTAGNPIRRGSRIATVMVTASEPGTAQPGGGRIVSDAEIQTALQGWVADGTVPATTANTLYFVYLPPDVVSTLGTDQSCTTYCGYHNHVGATVFYAVEPYVTCDGCAFGQVLDTQTKISSHELFEAITDPALSGWYDNGSGEEIGDICNGDTVTVAGYTVQSEWSQVQGACVVAPVAVPPAAPAAGGDADGAG
ncbi:MAG: hypothetical protein QOJ35_298 [Solirubrobacteraceae bacterium]|jgi:hypothetical protein|nr:hypothetical protein [Solirubrobacteraceae bacterium]